MSTASQAAELVQPFLERHPEYVRLGRRLYRRPIAHVRVGFTIGRIGYKGSVRPNWFIGFSFGRPPGFGTGAGKFMDRATGFLDQPDLQDRLLAEMELANSTVLVRATSLESLLELQWVADPIDGMQRGDQGLVLAALGRLREAEDDLGTDLHNRLVGIQLEPPIEKWHRVGSKPWQREVDARAHYAETIANLQRAYDLVAKRDRPGLAALLHDWEAQSARTNKTDHLWTPTPFPLELGAGD